MAQILAHYRLEELIGSGGMGRVYRAKDLALGRTCALKVLPPEFSKNLRERMLHEAHTSARLQHPSIATFYEAGQVDDQAYISMELVEGMTLRDRLDEGPLPLDQALSQTACLLDGLGHAHAVGVLHRDIKPANIMLVGDQSIKLLDFGLAKDIAQPEQANAKTVTLLTMQGAVVGTIGYMSPEQLRGEKLDTRSDLFSVGAVLYESISGKPAFPGNTPTERIANILAKEPEPLVDLETVSQINMVLQRALAKERQQRYSTVGEFMRDLSLCASGELNTTLPNSVVVMDFDNISSNPDDQWIGSGVAESISTVLSGTDGIDVTPREKLSRSLAEHSANDEIVDRQKIGLALGCRWMVTGGFQRMGPSLRFTIHLKELLTDRDVFNQKVDGSVESIFDMQDRLADLIKEHFAKSTAGSTRAPVLSEPEIKPRPKFSAYECYVKGRQAWLRSGKGDFDRAQEFFEEAIDVDPDYALAYAGLATVHALRFTYTTKPELISLTKSFATKALELDPNLAEAQVWLGYAYINEFNIPEGLRHQLRAIELDPNTFMAHYFIGGCLVATNSWQQAGLLFHQMHPGESIEEPHRWRFEQAVNSYQNAVRLKENHCWSWLGAGISHLALNQLSESEICLRRATEIEQRDPQLAGVGGYLCETLRRAGRLEEARQCGLEGIEAIESSDSMYRDTMRAVFLCSVGRAAFQQNDRKAARVAFNQATQHLRGRNRARGGGHPYVQALCGLAQTNNDSAALEEALAIYREPGAWSFHFLYLCTSDITLCALANAAAALGKTDLTRELKQEAIHFGSFEAAMIEPD